MSHFDLHSSVLWWSSEEKVIPYRSPIDGRVHRYYPDFLIGTRTADGRTQTVMIEVKPHRETMEPAKKDKINKRYIQEVYTWGKNSAKWKAAEEYCRDRGWTFQIMTEREIFGR